jgi:hypothetical protein
MAQKVERRVVADVARKKATRLTGVLHLGAEDLGWRYGMDLVGYIALI